MLVVTLPLEGFAIGTQPLLAHAFGANDPDRAARALRWLVVLACGVSAVLALTFVLNAGALIGLMTGDPAVAAAGVTALLWLAPALPAMALRIVAQICLQAMARAWMAAILGLAPMGWLLWPALAVLTPLGSAPPRRSPRSPSPPSAPPCSPPPCCAAPPSSLARRSLRMTSLPLDLISPTRPLPHDASAPPIFQTTSFLFDSYAQIADVFAGRSDRFIYSRGDNPTVCELEGLISRLEATEAARGFSLGHGGDLRRGAALRARG